MCEWRRTSGLDRFDQGGGHDLAGSGTRAPILDEILALRLDGDAHVLESSVGDHPLEFRDRGSACDAARYAAGPFAMAAGRSPTATMSEMASRPPGASTR